MLNDAEYNFAYLSVKLGYTPTEEQKAYAFDFTKPKICFADPGTGKTATSIIGLLMAELTYQIPARNIYALSFTNAATTELSTRYERACEKIGTKPYVQFSTLHALCSDILKKNPRGLNVDELNTVNVYPIESLAEMLLNYAKNNDIKLTPYNVRSTIQAMRSLNNSLIFDRENVESKMEFKKTKLSYEEFTKLRQMVYYFNKRMKKVPVNDIMLYTLELLTENPDISAAFKEQCKVMLIDEAQDMSLLQLRIVSLLTDNAIIIGDMKQQIYMFNGACPEIVKQYFNFYPNAETCQMTQSFRCQENIARYATSLILPNNMGGENFKGVSEGGTVEFEDHFDIVELCDRIEKEWLANHRVFPKDILFLFRNNYSATPLAEELFKRRVPFRVNKYKKANTIPIIKELCSLIELAQNPTTLSLAGALAYLIPELKEYRTYMDFPIVKVAEKKGCSIFDVNYTFKDDFIGQRALSLLLEVSDMLKTGRLVSDIFNTLWPVYYSTYVLPREPFLEYDAKYYLNQVNPVIKGKTYQQFIQDELQKAEFIEDNNARRLGLRCYTMHMSKGLEADIVHIIDADIDVIPNQRSLDKMKKAGCYLDIARTVRNERSLVYVALTRAKEACYVHYNGRMSTLLTGMNLYVEYDDLYAATNVDYNDVEEFKTFTKV